MCVPKPLPPISFDAVLNGKNDGSNTFNYALALIDPARDYAVLAVCNQGGKKKAEAATAALRNAVLEIMLAREAAAAGGGACGCSGCWGKAATP